VAFDSSCVRLSHLDPSDHATSKREQRDASSACVSISASSVVVDVLFITDVSTTRGTIGGVVSTSGRKKAPAIADWSCELGAKPSSVNRRQAVPLEKLIADTTPEREPEAGRSCEPLPVPAGSPAWTQAEQWAWQRICRSRVANMWQYAGPLHGEPPIDAPPDPRAPDRPPPPRPADLDDWNRWVTGNQALAGALTLGNTFLRQVLTQTAVGNYAVVALRNAYLESPDLRWVHSQRLLDIQHSYLAGEATFASAALGGLVINNSRVQRNLELTRVNKALEENFQQTIIGFARALEEKWAPVLIRGVPAKTISFDYGDASLVPVDD